MNRLREWGAFIFLGGFAWGTSFLWIKVGVQEIGPFTLVSYRLGFGIAVIWLLLWLQRSRVHFNRRQLWKMAFVGISNTAIPFVLISWSETRISSGLAGILNGTAPLFTIIIAHLFLHDERIKLSRLVGLVVGFMGLTLLLTKDIRSVGLQGNLLGQLATLLAAILYAGSSVYVRRYLKEESPILIAVIVMTSAWVATVVLALIIERPFVVPRLPMTWIAVAWLGVIGTALAYQIYFYLIKTWGPTRSILVTYVFPVVAVILGVLFLREALHWRLILGSAFIIGGIAAVNYWKDE